MGEVTGSFESAVRFADLNAYDCFFDEAGSVGTVSCAISLFCYYFPKWSFWILCAVAEALP